MWNGLNLSQQAAISEDGNALVIACPGSGKTRVLTLKIAKELEHLKHRTSRIAALTFTNRAADEIDKRVSDLGIDDTKLWSGTIHSFCLQWIIRPYGLYLPELARGFHILDEFKVERLKEEVKNKFAIKPYADLKTRRNRQGQYINEEENLNTAAEAYHKRIIENKEIDFDLILYFSYLLIERYPKIGQKLSSIFTQFFVDEFQDTQDLQYAIIGKIIRESNKRTSIFLVGDPDQAIFDSLGGTIKSKSEIEDEIGGEINTINLAGNYRSTQHIINFYRHFQSTDLDIKSKADNKDTKGIISFDKTTHRTELITKISGIIQSQLSKGVSPNEICILAPRWQFLTSFARELKAELPTIPLDAPGLTILPRSIDNFWYKLTRMILTSNEPRKHLIRMKWAKELLEELALLNITEIHVDTEGCRKFLKIINSIKIPHDDAILYLKNAFSYVFVKLGIDINLSSSLNEDWNHFFNSIENRYKRPDFKAIPKDISYMKKTFHAREGVVVNTCHGVKGEEFNTVIAFGLLKGYIPNWKHIIYSDEEKAKEESNKLLYVICSRSKENLFLFAEQGRLTNKGYPYEINYELENIDFDNV